MSSDLEPRPVRYSQITLTELMIPAYANFGGKIHGGILLSLMDKVAYACASKHSGAYCVTVAVEGVEFLQAVEVGEMVSMLASVNYVGKTSMLIGIKVISENFHTGTVKHTNSSYFTMVAKTKEGIPSTVPPLLLETKEELRRFTEGLHRNSLRKAYKEALLHTKEHWEEEDLTESLQGQRCLYRE